MSAKNSELVDSKITNLLIKIDNIYSAIIDRLQNRIGINIIDLLIELDNNYSVIIDYLQNQNTYDNDEYDDDEEGEEK
jgi:hypothetical protein